MMYFLGKNMKNNISLSSAEFANSVVSVDQNVDDR